MNPIEKAKLAKEIHSACHLTGNFILRSGRATNEYFDKYQLSANASLLYEITKEMALLIPSGVEVIAGLEMGAIPVVTMLSHHSGIPAAFVRKQAKLYGTARLVEGASIEDKSVLIIEDIVTSGGQVVLSTADMRKIGAKISNALVIIDRQDGGSEALKAIGVELISLFKKNDFDLFSPKLPIHDQKALFPDKFTP